MNKKRRNTFLDIESKTEVLKKIRSGIDKDKILKEYKISERTYFRLMTNESKILNRMEKPENKDRKVFRKVKDECLDAAVIEWFQQVRDRGDPVSGQLIREKALILNEKLNGSQDFKASSGWLVKFKKRYNIRSVDMKGESLSKDVESAEEFSCYLKNKISSENILLDNVYNADESGIYWRTIVSSTLSQEVEDKVSGSKERNNRITALFCSNATGSNRIPLLLIGKSNIPTSLKKLISREKKNNCLKVLECINTIYANQKNAVMSQEIFKHWFEEIFIPQVLNFQQNSGITGKIFLLLDNAPSHPPLKELNSINENIEIIFLPPNVSALVQPMNQGAISLTKKHYKKNILRNLLSAEKEGGADNFLNNLNYLDCFPLLDEAWNTVKISSLQEVWKPLLGDTCRSADTQRPTFVNSEATIKLELLDEDMIEIDEDVKFPQSMSTDWSRLTLGTSIKVENTEEVFRNWYNTEEYDCGWDPLSDTDIVNFVQNGKVKNEKTDENKAMDSDNSSDIVSQTEEITKSEALDGLRLFEMWAQQKTSVENFDKISILLGEVKNVVNED